MLHAQAPAPSINRFARGLIPLGEHCPIHKANAHFLLTLTLFHGQGLRSG